MRSPEQLAKEVVDKLLSEFKERIAKIEVKLEKPKYRPLQLIVTSKDCEKYFHIGEVVGLMESSDEHIMFILKFSDNKCYSYFENQVKIPKV